MSAQLKIEVVGRTAPDFNNVEDFTAWANAQGLTFTGFQEGSENPRLNFGLRVGKPMFKELCGPMNNGENCIRYETWEAYEILST